MKKTLGKLLAYLTSIHGHSGLHTHLISYITPTNVLRTFIQDSYILQRTGLQADVRCARCHNEPKP
jgi:hypothetical protein